MPQIQDVQTLCHLLFDASEKLAAVEGGSKIANAVEEIRSAIEQETVTQSQKRHLWEVFAPTCEWDDIVGDSRLGEDIFALLQKLYWEQIKDIGK